MVLATSARGEATLRRDAMQRPIADQVADVGRDPVGAGLDELVVVELLDVLLERLELAARSAPISARSGSPCCVVAHAVDGGQQRVEALGGRGAHGISSSRSSGPGCERQQLGRHGDAAARRACARPAAAPAATASVCDQRRACRRRGESRSTATTPAHRLRDRDHVGLLHRLAERARIEASNARAAPPRPRRAPASAS